MSGRPSATAQAQDREVRRPKTDALPLRNCRQQESESKKEWTKRLIDQWNHYAGRFRRPSLTSNMPWGGALFQRITEAQVTMLVGHQWNRILWRFHTQKAVVGGFRLDPRPMGKLIAFFHTGFGGSQEYGKGRRWMAEGEWVEYGKKGPKVVTEKWGEERTMAKEWYGTIELGKGRVRQHDWVYPPVNHYSNTKQVEVQNTTKTDRIDIKNYSFKRRTASLS